MKMTRMAQLCLSRISGALARFLAALGSVCFAALVNFLMARSRFSRDKMIDEQFAVEMVDLVLEAGGEQALGLDLAALVVAVEIAHPDLRRARDLLVIFGHRQAAFLVDRFLFRGFDDLRIGENIAARGSSSFLARSITSTRLATPIWIAARPMPGASYMVSSMSSISARTSSSTTPTFSLAARNRGSGRHRIGRMAMDANFRFILPLK